MDKTLFENAAKIVAAAAQSNRAFAALIILILGAIVAGTISKRDKSALRLFTFVATTVTALGLFAWAIDSERQAMLQIETQKIIRTAVSLRNDVNARDLVRATQALQTLSEIAPSSGHMLYFEGEVHRIGGPNRDIYQAIDWFVRYLDDPRANEMLSSGRTDAHHCYESAIGFCRQRTGWVAHLLANIFYQLSTEQNSVTKRREYLNRADAYLKISVRQYPDKFRATVGSPGQLADNRWSTDELSAQVQEALSRRAPQKEEIILSPNEPAFVNRP